MEQRYWVLIWKKKMPSYKCSSANSAYSLILIFEKKSYDLCWVKGAMCAGKWITGRTQKSLYRRSRETVPFKHSRLPFWKAGLRASPKSPSKLPHCSVRDELHIYDGLVFKGEQLVTHIGLRDEIKRDLHASHAGVEGYLRRARESTHWPSMSTQNWDSGSWQVNLADYLKLLVAKRVTKYHKEEQPGYSGLLWWLLGAGQTTYVAQMWLL